jgi:AraC-like DNA-binding protein
MNRNLILNNYGLLNFVSGLPKNFSAPLLPHALSYHALGFWGTIVLQEWQTNHYLLRYFLFQLRSPLQFQLREENEGLQSLVNLGGTVHFKVEGLAPFALLKNEFMLMQASDRQVEASMEGGQMHVLWNMYYQPSVYRQLTTLFPLLWRDLTAALHRPLHLLYPPKVARYSVHDAIAQIFTDCYIQELQSAYFELRMQTALFTMLAQTYSPTVYAAASLEERQVASAVQERILADITKHHTVEELAQEFNCTSIWLKRTFRKVYGMGIFHFLRKTRMEMARQMLVDGAHLKAVASAVGMKASTFPKEFKAYFGYTVTDLKKGLH